MRDVNVQCNQNRMAIAAALKSHRTEPNHVVHQKPSRHPAVVAVVWARVMHHKVRQLFVSVAAKIRRHRLQLSQIRHRKSCRGCFASRQPLASV